MIDEIDKAPEAAALFISDEELRRRMNPKIGRDRFKAMLREAELRGFPRKHQFWGGRYWPRVKAWLDSENEVNNHAAVRHELEDGPENFDAPPRTIPRTETRPTQSAVLDRAQRREKHVRLS